MGVKPALVLKDGDTWESLRFSLRIAIHKPQKLTHDFFEEIIDFMLSLDVDKHSSDFILDKMAGPKRLINHLMGELRSLLIKTASKCCLE